MSHNRNIDQLLFPIADPFRYEADTLLDLRDSVSDHPHPGRCMICYFKLLAAGPDSTEAELTPLRHWLEENVEIVAMTNDADETELEAFSLNLAEANSLEDCCQEAIKTVLHDRNFLSTNRISLEFRFLPEAVSA